MKYFNLPSKYFLYILSDFILIFCGILSLYFQNIPQWIILICFQCDGVLFGSVNCPDNFLFEGLIHESDNIGVLSFEGSVVLLLEPSITRLPQLLFKPCHELLYFCPALSGYFQLLSCLVGCLSVVEASV